MRVSMIAAGYVGVEFGACFDGLGDIVSSINRAAAGSAAWSRADPDLRTGAVGDGRLQRGDGYSDLS